MTVEKGKPCSIEFTVYTEDGTEIDSNVGKVPLEFIPGQNQILPRLEIALIGKEVGDEVSVELAPEEAYGPVDQNAFEVIPTHTLPEGFQQVGAILGLQDKNKADEIFQARVHAINADETVLDLNHPLAGKHLRFEIKILNLQN
ncbi:MAG: hypothetical protein A3F17_03985 [Gammaproteobacteria bacterium RIFCSPHIGHO2_12_FULL_41_15]|nr:MAG: hypothetical protein A3F17_03985 [Gammaproteobacteria bacterium RIFCSPHIGHO2_12_FULL_41_15]